jgi:hypothetical protein
MHTLVDPKTPFSALELEDILVPLTRDNHATHDGHNEETEAVEK